MLNNVEISKTTIYNSKLMNCSQKRPAIANRKIELTKMSSFIKNSLLRHQEAPHLLEPVLCKKRIFLFPDTKLCVKVTNVRFCLLYVVKDRANQAMLVVWEISQSQWNFDKPDYNV